MVIGIIPMEAGIHKGIAPMAGIPAIAGIGMDIAGIAAIAPIAEKAKLAKIVMHRIRKGYLPEAAIPGGMLGIPPIDMVGIPEVIHQHLSGSVYFSS